MAREYWAADCETDPFKFGRVPQPFIWGAFNGEDYHEFDTVSEFVSFFIDRDCVVYAHNGGKFDWHFLLDWIEPRTKIMVINGRLAKFKIGQAEFRDSYNLFPFALSEYKKDTFDYTLLEKQNRDKPSNRVAIRKYLRSDCVYLFDLLQSFFDLYGIRLTLPGAALAQWREISGEETDHSTAQFFETFSEFYYGGRVECFAKGYVRLEFAVYDLNSAYPKAMTAKHPWGTMYFNDNRLPNSDDKISRCFIELEARSTGAFPFRSANGLEFPHDGELRTFKITGWEYLAARDTNTLSVDHKIIDVIEFSDTIDFTAYVDHFYKLKADAKAAGKRGEELFAKYLLNGLYGKFASDPGAYEEFEAVEHDEPQARHEIARCGTCEGCTDAPTVPFSCDKSWGTVTELQNATIIARQLPEQNQRFYNVAVGASITGYVRALLWRAIHSGGNVIYCDTDSVAIAGAHSLDCGAALGQWKHEGDFSAYAIAGKKLYAFEYSKTDQEKGEKTTHKIASKGAKLNADQIVRIAKGEIIEYNQDAPTFTLSGKSRVRFNSRNMKRT